MLSGQNITHRNVIIAALPSQTAVQKHRHHSQIITQFPAENYKNSSCNRAVLPDVIKFFFFFFYWRYNPLWVLAFSVKM
jgi:hypothetical protein